MRLTELFESSPIYYSALTRAIEALPQSKAPGNQWANTIRNLGTKGVKQSEIEWSGVLNWLENQSTVTKVDLLHYLKSKEVKVQRTIHGTPRDDMKPDE